MIEQFDLFKNRYESVSPKHLRRNTDPSTSHAAAIKAIEFLGDHHRKVLAALGAIEEGTFYEIADASTLEPPAVWRRLNELEKLGYCSPTGEEREGPTGRKCRVWRLK